MKMIYFFEFLWKWFWLYQNGIVGDGNLLIKEIFNIIYLYLHENPHMLGRLCTPSCACLRAPDRRNDRNEMEGAWCARPSATIISLVLTVTFAIENTLYDPAFHQDPGGYFSMATGNKPPSDLVVSLSPSPP
jgi:hypothetical protein